MGTENNIFGEYTKQELPKLDEEIIKEFKPKKVSGKPRLVIAHYEGSYGEHNYQDWLSFEYWSKLRKYVSSVTVIIDSRNAQEKAGYNTKYRDKILDWAILGKVEMPKGSPVGFYPRKSNIDGGCDLFVGTNGGEWSTTHQRYEKETLLGENGVMMCMKNNIPATMIQINDQQGRKIVNLDFDELFHFVKGEY